MKDIAMLKFQNIDGEYIRFNRAKTQGTYRLGSKPISIYYSPEIQRIVNRWKSSLTKPDGYLFNILAPELSPECESARIKQFTRMVNTYIKLIATDVGIDKLLTTYYARHSFATILRRSGTSTDLISESLGHSSIKTTASYLDSFDDESKKDIADKLTRFTFKNDDAPKSEKPLI